MNKKRRRNRKLLKEEIRSQVYPETETGWKTYVLTYGSEILFTYHCEECQVMTKKYALNVVNNVLEDEGEEPLSNIKKIDFFRVA